MMQLKNIPSKCYYKQKVHSAHPDLLTYLLTFSTAKVHPLPVPRIAASLLFLPELGLHCVALAKTTRGKEEITRLGDDNI